MPHAHVVGAEHTSRRRNRRAWATGVLACALLALAPAAASAVTLVEVTPTFPEPVSVGDTAVGGTILITNTSSDAAPRTICDNGECGSQGITLTPACTTTSCVSADANVFTISATADGSLGCAGEEFAVVPVNDGLGTVRFVPNADIVLDQNESCQIAFTFDVEQQPATDALAMQTGRQTRAVAAATIVSGGGEDQSARTADTVTVLLAAPSITASNPPSPADDNTPLIIGSAPAGTTEVRLYTNATCTGTPVAMGSAAMFASGLTVPAVTDDTPTTYYATAIDSTLGVSECSSGFTYVEDSTAPNAPTINDTDPNSPSNDPTPTIKGTAPAATTIAIYTTANCSGSPLVSGSAALFTDAGLQSPTLSEGTTTFYATATDAAMNVSACSGPRSYVLDTTPPTPPSSGSTSPASPGNDNTPEIAGSAPSGTTVALYSDAACQNLVGEGSSEAFTTSGIQVTVADNSTTTFYATTTDAANNTSACTAVGTTYVEDSVAPGAAVVSGTTPGSPANDNAPHVRGTAPAGTTVRLYRDAACTGAIAAEGSAGAFASPGIMVTVADNTTTTFYARAVDAAGNSSPCAGNTSYVEDSDAPQTAIGGAPTGSPSAPTFTFSSSESGVTFECRVDLDTFAPCTSPFTTRPLGPGSHTFEVRSVDRAGNADPTAEGYAFTVPATAVTPPPPPAAKRAQPGCTGIAGRLYVGTSGPNIRNGTAGTDIMFGLGAKDTLRGAAGLDCIYGGFGNDVLQGGGGADRLFGDSGNDRLDGQAGNDRLSGQGGNDRINGGTGNDQMTGGAGTDRLTDRRGTDRLSGGAGNDRLDARDTRASDRRKADRILCGPGRDSVIADRRDSIARDCERVSLR